MSGLHFVILSLILLCCGFINCQQLNRSSAVVSFSIAEKTPIGTFVGDVKRSLTDYFTPADLQQMLLSFRLPNSYFSIDVNTGVIRMAQLFDRDVICAYQDTCKQNIEVQLKTSTSFQIIKVIIDVTDINDHSPVFTPASIFLSISELATPGTLFLLPSADDPDGGIDGIQSYGMAPSSAQFELVVTELADGSSDVRLRLKMYLVRAQSSGYSLTVSAVDGGNPPRSGYLIVNITVTSASVNELVFNTSTYDVTVKENVAIGTVLLYLSVNGGDNNKQILYTFDDYTNQQYGKILSLNNKTGALIVRGVLDYELYHVCLLTVVATNLERSSALPAYARVSITIQDLNDNPPSISVSTTSSGPPQVLVRSPVRTFVAYVAISDADSTSNVTCVIDSNMFILQPVYTDYNLLTAVVFDREYLGAYVLTITCQDNGVPSLSASQVIKVSVQGSGPRFATNIIGIQCAERNGVGQQIYTLNATTGDVGKAAELSYALSSLDDSTTSLWVNSITGVVSAMTVFHYDVKQRYLYVVTVTDGNEIPLSATATLVLDITRSSTNTNNSGGVGTLAPSFAQNTAGGENSSVVITAVVCATVIVIVIVVVVVISVLCYRRKASAAAEKRKNGIKVISPVDGTLAGCQRQTSMDPFNEDNKFNDIKEVRSDSSFDDSFNCRNSFVWPDQILGLPPKYPHDLSPKRGISTHTNSERLTWQQKRERLHSRYTIREDGSDVSHATTDPESDSGCSGSFADSGRGLSEGSEVGSCAYPVTGEITSKENGRGLFRRPSRSRTKRSRSGKTMEITRIDSNESGSKKNKMKANNITRTTSPSCSVSVSMSTGGKQSPRSASTSPNSWMPNSSRRSSPSTISTPRDNNLSKRKSVTFSRENSPDYRTALEENVDNDEYIPVSHNEQIHGYQKQVDCHKTNIPSNIPPLMLRENSPGNNQPFARRTNSPGIRQSISPKVISPGYRQSVSSRENSPNYQEAMPQKVPDKNYRHLIPRRENSPVYCEPLSPTETSKLQQLQWQSRNSMINYRHTMSPRKNSPNNYGRQSFANERSTNCHQVVLTREQNPEYCPSLSAKVNCTDYPLPSTEEDAAQAYNRQPTVLSGRTSTGYNPRQSDRSRWGKQELKTNTTTAIVECLPRNIRSYNDQMMSAADEAQNDYITTSPSNLEFNDTNPVSMCDTYV